LTTVLSAGLASWPAGAVIGLSRAPHEAHVTLSGGFIFPHIGQRCPAAKGLPHFSQTWAVSRFDAPQFEQVIISHSSGGLPQ
jgi:hypothetical protein